MTFRSVIWPDSEKMRRLCQWALLVFPRIVKFCFLFAKFVHVQICKIELRGHLATKIFMCGFKNVFPVVVKETGAVTV